MAASSKIIFKFGPFLLDAAEHQLLRDGLLVPLKPKVFDLLILFVENDGCLLPKDLLMQELWPDSFVEAHNLTVSIFSLRKALGDDANGESYIDTIPRVGYRFTGAVSKIKRENGDQLFDQDKRELLPHRPYEEEVGEQSLPAINPTKVIEAGLSNGAVITHKREFRSWRRISRLALLGTILICGLSIGLTYLVRSRKSLVELPVPKVKAIAVLPFKTLNPEVDEHLGVGMADALITELGKSREAIVRPMSAVLKYSNGERDLLVIGKELDVDAVLDGKIQRDGNRFRVTVQLVDIQSGETLLAEKLDQDLTSIFVMQDSISRVALALVMGARRAPRLATRPWLCFCSGYSPW